MAKKTKTEVEQPQIKKELVEEIVVKKPEPVKQEIVKKSKTKEKHIITGWYEFI